MDALHVIGRITNAGREFAVRWNGERYVAWAIPLGWQGASVPPEWRAEGKTVGDVVLQLARQGCCYSADGQ